MKKLLIGLAGAMAAALLTAPGAAAVNVTYSFDSGAQGWQITQSSVATPTAPTFNGGYISGVDDPATGTETGCPNAPCNLFFFVSPGVSQGLAANYGGAISFDLATTRAPGFLGLVYVSTGSPAVGELLRSFQQPGIGYHHITAPLTESGWNYCSGTPRVCVVPTQAQFKSVLAAAPYTDVLADVADGTGETYSLDNFTIAEPPPPPPLTKKKCQKKKRGKNRAFAAKKKKCKKKKGSSRSAAIAGVR